MNVFLVVSSHRVALRDTKTNHHFRELRAHFIDLISASLFPGKVLRHLHLRAFYFFVRGIGTRIAFLAGTKQETAVRLSKNVL